MGRAQLPTALESRRHRSRTFGPRTALLPLQQQRRTRQHTQLASKQTTGTYLLPNVSALLCFFVFEFVFVHPLPSPPLLTRNSFRNIARRPCPSVASPSAFVSPSLRPSFSSSRSGSFVRCSSLLFISLCFVSFWFVSFRFVSCYLDSLPAFSFPPYRLPSYPQLQPYPSSSIVVDDTQPTILCIIRYPYSLLPIPTKTPTASTSPDHGRRAAPTYHPGSTPAHS